jgi:hypothetical protein
MRAMMPESMRQFLRFIQLCQSLSNRVGLDPIEVSPVVYDTSFDIDLKLII